MTRVSAGDVAGYEADAAETERAQQLVDRYYGANPPSCDRGAIVTVLREAYEAREDVTGSALVTRALVEEEE